MTRFTIAKVLFCASLMSGITNAVSDNDLYRCGTTETAAQADVNATGCINDADCIVVGEHCWAVYNGTGAYDTSGEVLNNTYFRCAVDIEAAQGGVDNVGCLTNADCDPGNYCWGVYKDTGVDNGSGQVLNNTYFRCALNFTLAQADISLPGCITNADCSTGNHCWAVYENTGVHDDGSGDVLDNTYFRCAGNYSEAQTNTGLQGCITNADCSAGTSCWAVYEGAVPHIGGHSETSYTAEGGNSYYRCAGDLATAQADPGLEDCLTNEDCNGTDICWTVYNSTGVDFTSADLDNTYFRCGATYNAAQADINAVGCVTNADCHGATSCWSVYAGSVAHVAHISSNSSSVDEGAPSPGNESAPSPGNCWKPSAWWPYDCAEFSCSGNLTDGQEYATKSECCEQGAFGCVSDVVTPCYKRDQHWPARTCKEVNSVNECYISTLSYANETSCCASHAFGTCSDPDSLCYQQTSWWPKGVCTSYKVASGSCALSQYTTEDACCSDFYTGACGDQM